MSAQEIDAEMLSAHAAIGGFIARCSLLDYRVSQFIARWFCSQEKQKYLSYTLRAMPYPERRQVIEERLAQWHGEPGQLKQALAEISDVFERRDLAAAGVLSRRSSGQLCIKSFSAARFISGGDAVDILDVGELPGWSERASELSDRLIGLSRYLREAAG